MHHTSLGPDEMSMNQKLKYLFFAVLLIKGLEVLAVDPYQILGVSPTADRAEIKRAYKKLAMKWHPDKNSASNAQQKFIEVRQAYEQLNGLTQRRRYSNNIHNFSHNEELDEVLRSFQDLQDRATATVGRFFKDIQSGIDGMRVVHLFFRISWNPSLWRSFSEEEKSQVLQYAISKTMDKSEGKNFRKIVLNVLNSVEISFSPRELNLLNHLANDKQEPRALRSRAKKIVKKAIRSNTCRQTINDIRVL